MRSDARANRQDLVTAATGLLAEQGPGMSLRAVAQAAGVGVGTLYRHFPTRRDLITQVLEQVVGRLEATLRRFLDDDDVASAWRRLAEELGGADLVSLLVAQEGLAPEDSPPEEMFAAAERRALDLADAAVGRAREAGLVADGVTGEQFFAGVLTVTRPMPPSLEARGAVPREWLLETFLRGLRPD